MKMSLLLVAVLLVGTCNLQAQQIYQLKNRWKSGEYINVEQPTPSSGGIQPGWLSAQWTFEPVGSTGYYTIKNAWRNQYLNIETGPLTLGSIQPGWLSAHWSLEPVDGTSYYRIRNRWKPAVALHNQNGQLEAGPIDLGWWSAQWETVEVGGGSTQSSQAQPPSSSQGQPLAENPRRSNNPGAFTPQHGGTIATAIVRYTDQISVSGGPTITKGSRIYFFQQEIVDFNPTGVSFDAKNPAIGGQEFTVIEPTTPSLKLDRPMPMMRNTENSYFSLVVEIY
jgi:Ricin-type beta-trefoil lectin domain-like